MGLPRDGCGHGWMVWLIKGGCGDGCGDWRMWGGLWMPMVRDGRGRSGMGGVRYDQLWSMMRVVKI